LVDVSTLFAPAATHRLVDGQEMATAGAPAATELADHAPAPPAGSVEVTTFPKESTAAQNDVLGHDTAFSTRPRSAGAAFHAPGLQAGFVEVTTSPDESTATHSAVEGHVTAVSLSGHRPRRTARSRGRTPS
jgi:hypothetical protein